MKPDFFAKLLLGLLPGIVFLLTGTLAWSAAPDSHTAKLVEGAKK